MESASAQVCLSPTLLRQLDERAAREERSRSALIRTAIKEFLYDEEQVRIDREIREGYARMPQTDDESVWADL